MSYHTWSVDGFGFCSSHIHTTPEKIRRLILSAPKLDKSVRDDMFARKIFAPTTEDYLEYDQDEYTGLGYFLIEVIYEVEQIRLIAADNFDGETYVLYCPSYPWEDLPEGEYEVQKMCSISASMATMAFNQYFSHNISEYQRNHFDNGTEFDRTYWETLVAAAQKGAMFDARCFNIPKEEVTNLIYWRQLDATRNSIQMVGQAYFSHSELHCKSCNDIQDMLMLQKGINWNDFPVYQKRGVCVTKQFVGELDEKGNRRTDWVIDTNIPIFKGGRQRIHRRINIF